MRRFALFVACGLTLAMFAATLFGQPDGKKPVEAPTPVKLPISRVVLFNAGIGYFHREGTINGNARVDLKVNEEDVNDLILTLVANDPGGTARAVTYDNRAPADITLKAFSIDLTENPTVGQLLQQVRGEKVQIIEADGTLLTGNIVSVEKPESTVIPPAPVDPDSMVRPAKAVVIPPTPGAVEQVALLTEDGLQTVTLNKIKKIKFVKADLQAEFRKALEALAAARGANTKSVGVTFAGNGERKVSIGYIADAPLWKPTYRVVLGEGGAKIVGLAAVENTTDEDWENVQIKLVSGRPMTFKMDLYDPLFIPRPVIEPELYASLRPPVYQGSAPQFGGGLGGGGFPQGQQNLGVGGGIVGGQFGQGGFGGGQGGFGGQLGGAFGMRGGYSEVYRNTRGSITRPSVRSLLGERLDYNAHTNRLNTPETPNPNPTNAISQSTKNLGESFEYTVKEPVTLPRFKSALLPIVDEKIEAERISIFNSEILGSYPLKGLRIKNTSKLFLAQGPVAVYDGDTAAGQARLPDVKPGESRLLSYAIDLDVMVKKEAVESKRTPVSMKILDGVIFKVTRVKATQKYAAVNKSAQAKTVWVTQPILPNYKLIMPLKPVETTPDLYRFEVKLPENGTAVLEVIEETDEVERSPLDYIPLDKLEDFHTQAFTPPAVKTALGKVLALRENRKEIESGIAEEQAALKEVNEEQGRIRANMNQVPNESQAFKRYLKKFDDQETDIEKRQAKLKELLKAKERKVKELADLIKTLKAE